MRNECVVSWSASCCWRRRCRLWASSTVKHRSRLLTIRPKARIDASTMDPESLRTFRIILGLWSHSPRGGCSLMSQDQIPQDTTPERLKS